MTSKEESALTHFIVSNQSFIDIALRAHGRNMAEAATESREAHEAGAENGLITNSGYGQLASVFEEAARRAASVADELAEMIEKIGAGVHDAA